MNRRVLCFDFGASGGRAILAIFDGEKITLKEVHRFKNQYVSVGNTDYWDVLRLFNEIKTGLVNAEKDGGFECIGIDTWGVDYGLIDKNGQLIANPIQYRDKRTSGMIEEAAKHIDLKRLYNLTGNQIMEINTAFQLLADKISRGYAIENAECFLLMPDLFAFMLTGTASAEVSIASTTQLFNPYKCEWSIEAVNALGIPQKLLPKIVRAGESKGYISDKICRELNISGAEVAAVCGHDTQCAAFAAPAEEDDFIFLSCGTWSLLGTELERPVINEKSASLNITNEVGYDGKITFLKNITGLWLIQETKAFLESCGENYSYAELEQLAQSAEDFEAYIDTDDEVFSRHGDIPSRVMEYCRNTGQSVPNNLAEVMRCIYLSLAMKYRYSLDEIKECTNKEYSTIYMVGGGVQDKLLSQLTADICDIDVMAGPVEATAIGNAAIQLIKCGAITDMKTARKIIRHSEKIYKYTPSRSYSSSYETFKKIINRK